MAERACARLAGETVACPAECAVRHCLSGNAASAKVASGESVGTARVEAMEAWRATAHPEAAGMRRGRVETAARMEAATTHAHPAATHVEAATPATMESAAAPAASAAATRHARRPTHRSPQRRSQLRWPKVPGQICSSCHSSPRSVLCRMHQGHLSKTKTPGR